MESSRDLVGEEGVVVLVSLRGSLKRERALSPREVLVSLDSLSLLLS